MKAHRAIVVRSSPSSSTPSRESSRSNFSLQDSYTYTFQRVSEATRSEKNMKYSYKEDIDQEFAKSMERENRERFARERVNRRRRKMGGGRWNVVFGVFRNNA